MHPLGEGGQLEIDGAALFAVGIGLVEFVQDDGSTGVSIDHGGNVMTDPGS